MQLPDEAGAQGAMTKVAATGKIVSTIQVRKRDALVSWLFLRPGGGWPRLCQVYRADEGTGRAVVDLGGELSVTFDSAEAARSVAAACTEAAEALGRAEKE